MGGSKMKYCTDCGTPLIAAAHICPHCHAEQPEDSLAPRRWGWALVCGLLLPGGGQLYTGRPLRALLVHLLLLAAGVGAVLLVLRAPSPRHLLIAAGLWLLLLLASAAAAALGATRKGAGYHRRSWQRPAGYLAALSLTLLVLDPLAAYLVQARLFAPVCIQEEWMAPTLLPGDCLLVEKFSAAARHPERGDVVAFSLAGTDLPGPPTCVERIIGVPGDLLGMHDKELFINGTPVVEMYAVHKDPVALPGFLSRRDNFGPLRVPRGSYFLLGDNRDRALDSRFWGFVPASALRGRAAMLWWSWDGKHHAVRWARLGRRVE